MIKKETDKHINKIPSSPSLFKTQKITLCCTSDLFTIGLKSITKMRQQKPEYIEYI